LCKVNNLKQLEMEKTLAEAREELVQGLDEGIVCPCCKQFVKRYKRALNSGMAADLIRLYIMGSGYNNFRKFAKTGDYAKLKYWGLIKPMPNRTNLKSSGFWRITEKGKLFVKSEIMVEKEVFLYDGIEVGYSDEVIRIQDALKNKFNYKELMSC